MSAEEKVNILLVDDQPGKLLSYEVILRDLQENLLTANSAQEAFAHLLRSDIAVVLVDVCMPDLDGFELARMIREHPRFQKTAIIFISAVLLTHLDFKRGYESGAVDYVPVPVVPEILRAKVKVFVELFRKTRQLERLNHELEQRVAERTAELERSTEELRRSEERLRLALDAAQMGWWDYDVDADQVTWSPSLERIMGFSPDSFGATLGGALATVHPEDRERFLALVQNGLARDGEQSCELRFVRPDGSVRWSLAAGHVLRDAMGRATRFAGVDLDITARKQAEERQRTLVHELDHRAKNLLAVVQSVLHLSRGDSVREFIAAVDGRIKSLSHAHSLLSEARWQGVDLARLIEEEIAPFATAETRRASAAGPPVSLDPDQAQSLALAVHELVTNAVKYGALSAPHGSVSLGWELEPEALMVRWVETGGPPTAQPLRQGFGTKAIVASVERQLRGRVTFDWQPEGLCCTLFIPRRNVRALQPGGEAKARADNAAPAPQLAIGGRRVLVVEDEALVAILMQDVLGELGFRVLGPMSTMDEALVAAREEAIDAAILDVNLAGEAIYPVADALRTRQIPFVFVTGYSADAIDRRYASVPTLEKPIQSEALRNLFTEHVGESGGAAQPARVESPQLATGFPEAPGAPRRVVAESRV